MSNRKSDNYNFAIKIRHYGNDIEYVVVFDDFPNLIGAGDTIEEAIEEAKDNLEVYINDCIENNVAYPAPSEFTFEKPVYSGKISLRMSKSLHQKVSLFAEKENVSLNSFINDALNHYILYLSTNSIFKLTNLFMEDTSQTWIHYFNEQVEENVGFQKKLWNNRNDYSFKINNNYLPVGIGD